MLTIICSGKDPLENLSGLIKILELSPDEMEEVAAAILRAMGYRTRIITKL